MNDEIKACTTNYLMKTLFSFGWTAEQIEEIRTEIARRWAMV